MGKLNAENQKIDANVLMLISSGLANTAQAIVASAHLDENVVDNSLRRLKAAELVAFVKADKRWQATKKGQGGDNRGTNKTPPSAPDGDAAVGSGDTQTPGGDAGQKEKNMETKSSTKDGVAEIDAAIARAKGGKKPEGNKTRLSAEEKEAKAKEQAEQRAKAKAEREQVRATKKAEKQASKQPAHMSKVAKAADKLPSLSKEAELIFNESTTTLDAAGIAALSAHLTHFNRVKATERALGQTVNVGDEVEIVAGSDTRYIGKVGTVVKAQRIRCYVKIDGFKKDAYFYTSDVKVVKAAPKAAANG